MAWIANPSIAIRDYKSRTGGTRVTLREIIVLFYICYMQKLLIIVIVSFLLLKLTACKKHGKTTDTNNLQNYYPYDTYTDTVIKYFADNI